MTIQTRPNDPGLWSDWMKSDDPRIGAVLVASVWLEVPSLPWFSLSHYLSRLGRPGLSGGACQFRDCNGSAVFDGVYPHYADHATIYLNGG